jgi:hypothetical protein
MTLAIFVTLYCAYVWKLVPRLTYDEHSEGSEKTIRRGEWESIKISRRNLTYVPKLTRCPPLLTRPRPPSYRQIIGP